MPDFLPRRDADLLQWANAFVRHVGEATALPALASARTASFRGMADALAAAHARFAEASAMLTQADTRTTVTRQMKETARAEMVALIRPMASQLRGQPDLDAATFVLLGLRPLRDGRAARLPTPRTAPVVELLEAAGRRVRVRLHDVGSSGRVAKPPGVSAALWFTAVGEDAFDPAWVFGGQATRTMFAFDVDASVPLGATLLFVAQWVNPRGQAGPSSLPMPITVGGGATMDAATHPARTLTPAA